MPTVNFCPTSEMVNNYVFLVPIYFLQTKLLFLTSLSTFSGNKLSLSFSCFAFIKAIFRTIFRMPLSHTSRISFVDRLSSQACRHVLSAFSRRFVSEFSHHRRVICVTSVTQIWDSSLLRTRFYMTYGDTWMILSWVCCDRVRKNGFKLKKKKSRGCPVAQRAVDALTLKFRLEQGT